MCAQFAVSDGGLPEAPEQHEDGAEEMSGVGDKAAAMLDPDVMAMALAMDTLWADEPTADDPPGHDGWR